MIIPVEVVYLRRLKDLRSLTMADNPCIDKKEGFRSFVACFIPQLIYYDYMLIDPKTRDIGKQEYA
jgi:hypothetical protein